MYTQPVCSTYKWWSTSDSPASLNTWLTSYMNAASVTYYAWFDRNSYDLLLLAWVGIDSVNGSWTYKYGANISIDAVVKSWYTWNGWTLMQWDLTTFRSETKNQNVVMWCMGSTLLASATLDTYIITYNLNWWTETVANPATYTVESWSITLAEPTKVWYTFLWWTWSNGNVAQTGVTIPTWSYGNKTYNAVWQANTNTPYIVYHYVKRVWSGTYELADTETKQWTTDETLILSWLAKENEFLCATYDRWSLTWTEDWPWEVVTQTTLKWDGSLKIYLYYNRNSRRVILSGDEHVQYLQIDGEEVTEAVWECGGEVPVNAVPKPWYHFVRWDRERERTQEDDDEETTWW